MKMAWKKHLRVLSVKAPAPFAFCLVLLLCLTVSFTLQLSGQQAACHRYRLPFSPPAKNMPSFLSRRGFSIPAARCVSIRVSLTHTLLALSANSEHMTHAYILLQVYGT